MRKVLMEIVFVGTVVVRTVVVRTIFDGNSFDGNSFYRSSFLRKKKFCRTSFCSLKTVYNKYFRYYQIFFFFCKFESVNCFCRKNRYYLKFIYYISSHEKGMPVNQFREHVSMSFTLGTVVYLGTVYERKKN